MPQLREHAFLITATAVWALLIAGGYWRLFNYANTPGQPALQQVRWPATTVLEREPRLPTLVIFAHPRCPCSAATVGELARLWPQLRGKVKSIVTFFKPKARPLAWAKAGLWEAASAIPGVEVVLDEDGLEAAHFGARTSGQVFLYDSGGNLVFRGGITPERGHMGDSEGRLTLLTYFETGKIIRDSTPVYGCSIRNPERAPAEAANEK